MNNYPLLEMSYNEDDIVYLPTVRPQVVQQTQQPLQNADGKFNDEKGDASQQNQTNKQIQNGSGTEARGKSGVFGGGRNKVNGSGGGGGEDGKDRRNIDNDQTGLTNNNNPNEILKNFDLSGHQVINSENDSKGLDKLRLKIARTVVLSICIGIIFSGLINFLLATVASNHISEITTQQISEVQIDYTRTIGLHLACVYQHMIQEQIDKTFKILAKLKIIFPPTPPPPPSPSATDYHNQADNGYNIYTASPPPGTDYACITSITPNYDKMMWYTIQGDIASTTLTTPTSTKIDIVNLAQSFPLLRAISQDKEIMRITLTLNNDIELQYPLKYDKRYSQFATSSTTITPTTTPDYINTRKMFDNNGKRLYYSIEHVDNICSGTTTVMLGITICLAVLCGDIPSAVGCAGAASSTMGGTICLYHLIKESSFLHSLKDRNITKIYLSQLNSAQISKAYTPLLTFDSNTTVINPSFWQNEFGVTNFLDSSDASAFYRKFDQYYQTTMITMNDEYLVTSSYDKSERQYLIAIYQLLFDTDPALVQLGAVMTFTTITLIPTSQEIFSTMLDAVSQSMVLLLFIGIILLIIIMFLITLYIYKYSEQVIIPINRLQDEVSQIAQGNLEITISNDTSRHWLEIDQLFVNFEHLNKIIKASDDQYYQNLSAESLIKYSNSYILFENLGNRKGMGIVLNNIGNINMKLDRLDDAVNSYKEAFLLSERELLELLLVDNIYAMYNVRPFEGWESAKKYDFSYDYLIYQRMKNRKKVELLCTSNKSLLETIVSNRSYQLAKAYFQIYQTNTTEGTSFKQQYLTLSIDHYRLTERLDQLHSKCSSRTIFTKLKLSQAYIEKAKYFLQIQNYDKHILMYFQSIIGQDSAVEQLSRFEEMYTLFEDQFKNEIPPEVLRQHCKLQEGICNREFSKFKNAVMVFTQCLKEGIHFDPWVREQCLKNIKEILEQEKKIDQAPELLKMLKNTSVKKQKDIVFVLDFSQSMEYKPKQSSHQNLNDSKYLEMSLLDNEKTHATRNSKNINNSSFMSKDNPSSATPHRQSGQGNPFFEKKIQQKEMNMKDIAIQKFLFIFDEFVQMNDRVAFMRFNENIDIVFELIEKWNNTLYLQAAIQNSSQLQPQGESAVRQAICSAIKLFQKTVPKDHSKWVVVFTDGGDSCSSVSESQLLNIIGKSDINLMIIGCGLDKYATKVFRLLCEKTKNGIFIQASSNQTEIDIAFQAITNKIYGNSDLNYNVEAFV